MMTERERKSKMREERERAEKRMRRRHTEFRSENKVVKDIKK